MSNTPYLRPRSKDPAHYAAVRKLVAERAGREWCLFLDRDGVINRRIVGGYVCRWEDFEWLPKASLALKMLKACAPNLVVVTNQQGIGKGLMSTDDLAKIHEHIEADLSAVGACIDAFEVCPHLESAGCGCRKPQPGLVLDWLGRHPDSEPSLSIMVGDSQSDLELARNVAAASGGCASIQIGQTRGRTARDAVADASFDSLWDFAIAVARAQDDQR
jgi:histidinol-phosphate phosphatase family protein